MKYICLLWFYILHFCESWILVASASPWHATPTHCPWGWCGHHDSTTTQMETLQRSAASWATRSRRAGMRGWRALGRSMRKLTDNSCVFGATCPTVLLQTSRAGWECRWWSMLSCTQQTAVASALLGNVWRSLAQPFGDYAPQPSDMLQLADACGPRRA